MIHNFYYRLLFMLLVGTVAFLSQPDTVNAQSNNDWNSNWDWTCDGCNDNNPCTVDLCFFGHCFNIPLRNCGNDYDCEIKIANVEVGECYVDPADNKSKAKLKVCVWWREAPANKDIKVSINGQEKIIDVDRDRDGECVEFVILANGSTNNKVSAQFLNTNGCKDEKTYKAPVACEPLPNCELEITKATVGDCYYDQASGKSKAPLEICVKWKNRPSNEKIMVSINGETKWITPSTSTGSECVTFAVLANGSSGNGIWAKFERTDYCMDEAKYNTPNTCIPANCELEITSASVSTCYFDHNDYKSKAKLTVCVKWQNRPANDVIMVSIDGQTKTFTPGNTSGSQCVEFIILANGTTYNGIWAKFKNAPSCQDESKYHAPQPCQPLPECDLEIKSVSVSSCYFDHNSYKSKAKLTICVKWTNRPTNDKIMVSINGQSQTITPSSASGSQCVEFVIDANGTTNNNIWAKFLNTPDCQDEDKYHSPQPCQPLPECDLDITSVSVSSCYFDHNDYKSKAKLTVCVKWTNRPANENIMVSINGQSQTIATSNSSGSKCVEFVIPANGTQNQGIWAKFQYTSDCQDEDKYHAPQPCQPLPECDLEIKSVSVGSCYFDHSDYKSKAKLTVCVKWTNRPTNENIIVSINGQTKTITPSSASGSQCVEFVVAANGTYNNGIWAKFQYTQACQDEAKYNTPQPCQPLPECKLDITSVNVSNCYYDYDSQSKAKLTICVKWENRPTNENIIVSINGQTKTITPSSASGSQCVEFVIPANGAQNQGIWAKFQNTQACQDEAKYSAPSGCQPSCDLEITDIAVSECFYDELTNSSFARVNLWVDWSNRPGNENILVTLNGQTQTIVPTAPNGLESVEFTVPANGTTNNVITARFQNTTSCKDEDKYNAPQPCLLLPACEVEIMEVHVGDCYYDQCDFTSKAELTVCVKWKDRPGSEKIIVSINGQSQTITPSAATGMQCVQFIIPANGSLNNNITAKFESTTACQDQAKYNAPQACQPLPQCDIDIMHVEVGSCYFESGNSQSKAKLNICVKWTNRPANDKIVINIGGQSQTITPASSSGVQCVEFVIPANGAQNQGIWAKFQNTPACQDEDKYNAPQPCQPLPQCDLDITSVNVSNCYIDSNTGHSKAKLTICVKWANRPTNENIIVSINGQSQTFTPSSASGTKCVEFLILANGAQNQGIWAKFQNTQSCQDEHKYNAPQPCQPLPECDLDITSVNVSSCYYDHNDYQSKAKLTVCVKWTDRPGNENIVVSINGQTKTVSTGNSNGTACVEFIIPSNGAQNQGIWAKFQNTQSCQDEDKYHAPQPCQPLPQCDLDITSVSVSSCYFDQGDAQSKAKLTVCVKWTNRPGNEYIVVSINNQYKTITPSSASGSQCVEFIIPANGVQNQGIWAKFQYTTACQDEAKYHAPYNCQPLPACDLDITNVSVSDCYFDHNDYQSKTKVTICVKWTNRPTNENILVSTNGQTKVIYPGASSGSQCVEFIVAANGSHNNGVWAKFQYTSNCQDEAFYDLPYACYQTPECNIDITGVSVSNCYFDHYDYKSKATLKVCIKWENAPAGEKIKLLINGQGKLIAFNASSGSVCVEFTIAANGVQNQGIWAKFEYTTDCQAEAFYHAPYACQPYGLAIDNSQTPITAAPNQLTKATEAAALETLLDTEVAEGVRIENLPAAAIESEMTPVQLRVFPNPTRHELNVDLKAFTGKAATIQVFNAVGKVMYETNLDEVTTEKLLLDVRQYANEMYLIKVHIPGEGTFTQKFIVSK